MSRGQVRTFRADGTSQPRYLGALGPVSGLKYSFSLPGGCEQMSCLLQVDPAYRTEALDPGRYVQVNVGGDVIWDGTLDEPQQQAGAGWAITAHGSGTWGADFAADYTGNWGVQVPDGAVNNAIGRGLGWVTSAVGHPAGMWLSQPQDAGSVQVDAMLNLLCSMGGLTWQVKRCPRGNLLQVFSLPTAPTRLLVTATPAPRTLGGDVNAIELRYQASPNLGSGFPATYATTWATDAASIARHGRKEAYADLSSSGPMLATDAQAVGNFVLQRYQRASYAGPFTVTAGQLRTVGGQPCDLGCFYLGNEGPMVCKVLLADQGYGGEVAPGPVSFLVGRYEYDDDADTAVITPFQSLAGSFASFLAARASAAKGRAYDIRWRGKRHVHWTAPTLGGLTGKRKRHVTWTPTWHFDK